MRLRYVFLTFVLLGMLFLPSAGAQSVRFRYPDEENTLTGYLTWNDGQGGVAWEPGQSAADPGGPPLDTSNEAAWAQQRDLHETRVVASYFTGVQARSPAPAPYPAPDVFDSQPLPRRVQMNPLENIEVDLYISRYTSTYGDLCASDSGNVGGVGFGGYGMGPDPWLEVQVYADGKLIGGDTQARTINWYGFTNNYYPPNAPAGYAICRYRFHSEVDVIDQGAVLSVKIIHHQQTKAFQYGMADDHASVVRLVGYSDIEWAYRDPGAGAAGGGEPADDGPQASALLAQAGVGAVAIAGLARPRARRRTLGLLLALVILSSGCFGATGNDAGPEGSLAPAGDVTTTLVPDDGSGAGARGNGSVYGLVLDHRARPIEGVHVSLLGTDLFTQSDEKGRFTFIEIPPVAYTARFDKVGYRSFETQVAVQAGFNTKPHVTLYLIDQKEGDAGEHIHDYWAGETSRPLMEQSLSYYCSQTNVKCRPSTGFTIPPPEEGGGIHTILPGTYDVEVTVTWNRAQIPLERVGLSVIHNGNGLDNNRSILSPRASGVPFHVRTAWEMSDPGHQQVSSWFFDILPAMMDPTSESDYTAGLVGGSGFNVKVVIHKGLVPLEPAHPDLWAGANTAVVTKSQATLYHSSTNAQYGVQCYASRQATGSSCTLNWAYFSAMQQPIPGDALWLEAIVNQSQAMTPSFGWDLFYKTADMGQAPYAQYKKSPAGTQTGLSWRFVIPLKPGEADPFYAKKSSWAFNARPMDEQAAMLEYSNPTATNTVMSLLLIAHKDEMR